MFDYLISKKFADTMSHMLSPIFQMQEQLLKEKNAFNSNQLVWSFQNIINQYVRTAQAKFENVLLPSTKTNQPPGSNKGL